MLASLTRLKRARRPVALLLLLLPPFSFARRPHCPSLVLITYARPSAVTRRPLPASVSSSLLLLLLLLLFFFFLVSWRIREEGFCVGQWIYLASSPPARVSHVKKGRARPFFFTRGGRVKKQCASGIFTCMREEATLDCSLARLLAVALVCSSARGVIEGDDVEENEFIDVDRESSGGEVKVKTLDGKKVEADPVPAGAGDGEVVRSLEGEDSGEEVEQRGDARGKGNRGRVELKAAMEQRKRRRKGCILMGNFFFLIIFSSNFFSFNFFSSQRNTRPIKKNTFPFLPIFYLSKGIGP